MESKSEAEEGRQNAKPGFPPSLPDVRLPGRCLILANPKAGTLRHIEFFKRLGAALTRPFRAGLPSAAIPDTRHALANDTSVRNAPHAADPSADLPLSLDVLAQTAADAGLVADVEPIPPLEELTERMRAAQKSGYATVIAVGGDGTVRGIANGLIRAQVPLSLGIVPLGTANNIARALHLPSTMEDALQLIAQGQIRQIDAGHLHSHSHDEYFLEAAGVGLFADAVMAFGPNEPHRHEILRIARVVLPLLWNPVSRRVHLTLDGMDETDEALLVTVSNSPYLAEGFPFAPNASLSDGLFEVVIVGKLKRREMPRFALDLLRGRHLQAPYVRHGAARTVTIRRPHPRLRPLSIHADDHSAGTTPVTLEIVPGVLTVFVPPHVPNPLPERVS